MGDHRHSQLDQLWAVVRSIPAGRVASYGAVGRALEDPASGFMVGGWGARKGYGAHGRGMAIMTRWRMHPER